jgi:hypothetical protein
MTIQDKIAALPRKPGMWEYPTGDRVALPYEAWIDRIAAERDLALEALRDLLDDMALEHSTKNYDVYQVPKEAVADARAVLAACGGESE